MVVALRGARVARCSIWYIAERPRPPDCMALKKEEADEMRCKLDVKLGV